LLNREECRVLAAAKMGPERVILDERTLTFSWGWSFMGSTPEYARTRRFEDAMLGEGAVLVDKHTGHVETTGSGLPIHEWARRFERRNGYRPWWRLRGTLSGCPCVTLPFAWEIHEVPRRFMRSLREIDRTGWFRLHRCPRCGVLWCVEGPVYKDIQFAVRVDDAEDFERAAEARLKLYLLESRGGLDPGACSFQGCSLPRVRDMMLCVDHLFESGARR